MKKLLYNLTEEYEFPQIIKELFQNRKVCIFDIETTGLDRNKDKVILIGYLYFSNGKPIIKQIFAENYDEEKSLLIDFNESIKNFDLLITYNGKNFDIPFLSFRFDRYDLSTSISHIDHIDIFQHLKIYKNHLNLTNYRLKSIESFLGIDREDTISGKESVKLYEKYIKTKEANLLDIILLHNYEDIYHLGKVLNIYNVLPIHKKEFSTEHIERIYNSESINFRYNVIDVVLRKNNIYVYGKTNILHHLMDEIHHQSIYKFIWIPKKGVFELNYFLKSHKISDTKQFHSIDVSSIDYIDFNNYYYKPHIINNNLIMCMDLKLNIDVVTKLIHDTIESLIF